VTAASKPGCDQTERVADYAVRALPEAERLAVQAHLNECLECRAELMAVRPVVDNFVHWPTDILRPPTPLWGRLAESIGVDVGGTPPESEARWAGEPDWNEVAPGISCKLLATNEATDYVSMLVRLAPGVEYPPHTHAGVEELHLLDGELWIDGRKLSPGDYNRAEPGTGDNRVWSETGCTCLLLTSSRDILR
jgi:anti-sigma factor ChrR (cupin superfamily)